MGFFSKLKAKLPSPIKSAIDVGETLYNPVKQIKLADKYLAGGAVTQTADGLSGGLFSRVGDIGYGDFEEAIAVSAPVLTKGVGGNPSPLQNLTKGVGGNMSFFDDIGKSLNLDFGKVAGNLLGGLTGSGGTQPANEVLFGQAQKAIEANQNQTSSMIASLQKNMIYIVGGLGAVVVIFLLLGRKR